MYHWLENGVFLLLLLSARVCLVKDTEKLL